ncbi:hypothetical protein AB8O38_15190 [Saccharomonospora xinjiangensis]|uniref:hypothetical protein n=1 Tax=Saccharomonospora xinjiangensis TaxID=75294 RepID=UPI0035108272
MPQRFRTRALTRDVAAVVLGLGLTAVAVAPALATEVAGEADAMSATDAGQDPRAEVHDGNAVDCEDFGGGILVKVDDGDKKTENVALTYEGGVPGQDRYLTITEVPSGIDVTAIVVKGGDGYNVYVPGARDLPETVPWEDLRAPLNNGGNIPAISHWYACGAEEPSATPTSEPTSPNPNPGEPEPSQTPGEEPPSGEPTEAPPSSDAGAPATSTPAGGGASVPETTESAPAPVAEDDDLASTGFSGGWLIGLGAALVAGGGALLAVTRLRKGKTTS